MLTAEIIATLPEIVLPTKDGKTRPAHVRTQRALLADGDDRIGTQFARRVSIRDLLIEIYDAEETSSTGLNILCPGSSEPHGENIRIEDDADADRCTVWSETLASELGLESGTHTMASWDWLIRIICDGDAKLAAGILRGRTDEEVFDLIREFTDGLVTDNESLRAAVKLSNEVDQATIPFTEVVAEKASERPSTRWDIADGYFVTLEPGKVGTYKSERQVNPETGDVSWSNRLVRPYVVYATQRRRQMVVSPEGVPRVLRGADEYVLAVIDSRGTLHESDWMTGKRAKSWEGVDEVDAPIAKPLQRSDTDAIINGIRVLGREDRVETTNWTSMGWVQDGDTIAYIAPSGSFERGVGVTDRFSVDMDSRSDDSALSEFDRSVGLAPASTTDEERSEAMRAATLDLFGIISHEAITGMLGAFAAALLGMPGFTCNLTAPSDSGKSMFAGLVQGLTSDLPPDGDAVGIYLPQSRPAGIVTKAGFYRHMMLMMDDFRISRNAMKSARATEAVEEVVQGIYGSTGGAKGAGAGSLARVASVRTSAILTSEVIHGEKAIRRRMLVVEMKVPTSAEFDARQEWADTKHLTARRFLTDFVAWLADRVYDAGGVQKFAREMRRQASVATGANGGVDTVGRCEIAWRMMHDYALSIGDKTVTRWIRHTVVGEIIPKLAKSQGERVRETSPAFDAIEWLVEEFHAGRGCFAPAEGTPDGITDADKLTKLGWRHDTARQAWVEARTTLGIASHDHTQVFIPRGVMRSALEATQHDPRMTPITELMKKLVSEGTTAGGSIPASLGIANARGKKGFILDAAQFFGTE